jgi:D-cysteine desulfhydrase
MELWSKELTNKGHKPYIIPIGGSTGLGALGYVKAMQEISTQFKEGEVQIILGVGSCGTFAGTILGSEIFLPSSRVIGVSVSRTSAAIEKRTKEIILESAQLINYDINTDLLSVESHDDYFTEYGQITEDGKQAIIDCANLEGILLDPVYTGKVMAGLKGLVEREIIDNTIPVIFIHTGGMPIIFSFEEEFKKFANYTKIKNMF